MNILLVNRWYPPYSGYGGVAMYNYYLTHALKRQGHQVSILAARWSKSDPEIQDDDGIKVTRILAEHKAFLHRLPLIGRYMRPLIKWNYSRKVANKIREMEKKEHFDIIEFAEVGAEGFVYLRRGPSSPVVVRCHTPTFVLKKYYLPEEMPYNTGISERMEKFCISQADGLTAPSKDMANLIEHICDLESNSVVAIPNPLDLTPFLKSNGVSQKSQRPITVLHVGRMERIKGIETLIKAAEIVNKACSNVRFVFIGGGSDEYLNHCQQLAYSLDIPESAIEFLGKVNQETLFDWYQCADIAVIPTLNYESFSYTVAQALAAGLPVVASCIGGIPETVGDEGSALLIEPGNHQQLAKSLITLCQDSLIREKMAAAGLRHAKLYFSDDIVAEKMIVFYLELARKKASQ